MATAFLLIAALMFLLIQPARAEAPDVSWPVKTRPTETALNGKIETLDALIRKIDARKLDSSYSRSALVLARDFIVYARDDEKNGRPGRAAYARSYLDESLDAAITSARALLANPQLNRPVPRPALRDISIRNGAFFAGDARVMFGGVGHFSQVRADIPKFPDYGFNLIQIEIGPSAVVTGPEPNNIRTDSIDNDIIKTLDRAAQNGVMVNLLLSPHYFPDWAMKMYPELNKCGKGFIQYCISDPDARRVLRRYLQTLIPKVKDKPALQSYTLANEPLFMERNDETLRRFQLALREKYGDVSALNRAWRKKYASFDSVKINEDFLNLNSAARLDWVTFHNKIGTEFFYWMKSVIRTMDKRTPVHIKFMDNMFDHFEAMWGIDREALEKITEISGNDSSIGYPGAGGYALNHRQNAAFFDFLKSVRPGNPVQNSENHIIRDDAPDFYPASYIRAALMLQYLHGMGASTIWVWERSDGYQLGNNILSRPNCAAAAARATLDARRLAQYITALSNAPSGMYIYYSQTSRILQRDFPEKWDSAYEQALYQGEPVRFLTDKMLEAGPDPKRVKLLLVPEYAYTSDALYGKLIDFVGRGGKVVAIGDVFRFNEKALKRKTSAWDALGCGATPGGTGNCVYKMKSLSSEKMPVREESARKLHEMVEKYAAGGAPGLTVSDASGRHVLGVEYRYATVNGRRVAYIFNALSKDVALKLSDRRGTWKTTADMIDGKPVTANLKLPPLRLVMFSY